ncbi:MAG TPA: hypothetical protein VM008_22360 [Phycisphaerae bacterium]|nr:hypothetical protein [Phycisphaerae bacterium]
MTAGCGNHDVAACCGNIVVHPAEWFSTASIAAWEGGLQTLFRGDQDYVAFERVMGEAFGRVTIWILARRVAAQR